MVHGVHGYEHQKPSSSPTSPTLVKPHHRQGQTQGQTQGSLPFIRAGSRQIQHTSNWQPTLVLVERTSSWNPANWIPQIPAPTWGRSTQLVQGSVLATFCGLKARSVVSTWKGETPLGAETSLPAYVGRRVQTVSLPLTYLPTAKSIGPWGWQEHFRNQHRAHVLPVISSDCRIPSP